ncbi:hypothetical protein, partial [Shewanella algae]|uniref:hypothetical protein n=1 Tax=Shewanella algae TaxID=38313 RepID=UPI00313F2AD9
SSFERSADRRYSLQRGIYLRLDGEIAPALVIFDQRYIIAREQTQIHIGSVPHMLAYGTIRKHYTGLNINARG